MADVSRETQMVLLTNLAATAADRNSDDIHNELDTAEKPARGILLRVVTANEVTTPTVRPRIQAKMSDGTYVDYWFAATTTGAGVDANGTAFYLIHPDGLAAPSGEQLTEIAVMPLPSIFRLQLDFAGAGSIDTFVDAQLLY